MKVNLAIYVLISAVACPGALLAETETILLLHTNDFHDHIRESPADCGGLPYVSGYVQSVKSKRRDVLLLDGGDVLNKGDLVSHVTKGSVMYSAMKRIGYDVGAPGNHDFTYGLDNLYSNMAVAGFPIVCANAVSTSDRPLKLPKSVVVEVDGISVGVIGATTTSGGGSAPWRVLSLEETGQALAAEAERLEPQVQLTIVVIHRGSNDCRALAKAAPGVDVFVAAHTHEALQQPLVVDQSDTLIVEAGSNANYVGRLELTIDVESEDIVAHRGELVRLDHDTTPCDEAMASWVRDVEQTECPMASRVFGKCEKGLNRNRIAEVTAKALSLSADTEIGLCNTKFAFGGLMEGQVIDLNAIFTTHVYTAREVYRIRLTGAQLIQYLDATTSAKYAPRWHGFQAQIDARRQPGSRVTSSDLEPSRVYRVALTGNELPVLKKALSLSDDALGTAALGFDVVDAWVDAFDKLGIAEPETASP